MCFRIPHFVLIPKMGSWSAISLSDMTIYSPSGVANLMQCSELTKSFIKSNMARSIISKSKPLFITAYWLMLILYFTIAFFCVPLGMRGTGLYSVFALIKFSYKFLNRLGECVNVLLHVRAVKPHVSVTLAVHRVKDNEVAETYEVAY